MLIFGIRHSNVLEVRTKIAIYNKGLLGKGKIECFYLDVILLLQEPWDQRMFCNEFSSSVILGQTVQLL